MKNIFDGRPKDSENLEPISYENFRLIFMTKSKEKFVSLRTPTFNIEQWKPLEFDRLRRSIFNTVGEREFGSASF